MSRRMARSFPVRWEWFCFSDEGPEVRTGERLQSLDALRGADMLMITGFTGVVSAVCAALGAPDCWLTEQFVHAPWRGLRFEDTIFPLFLFLSGATWPFSLAKSRARGMTTAAIVRKVLLRAFWLVVFGFTYAPFFRLDFAGNCWVTVLTHIGICWAAAALIYLVVGDGRRRLAIAGGILLGYWALLRFVTAPDQAALLGSTDPEVAKAVAGYAATGTDGFSFTGNLAGWVDRTFQPGSLYEVCHHADGLLAKIPGTVTAILGMFAGDILRRTDIAGGRRTVWLLAAGGACLALCLVGMPFCPVVKKIWTPTFVLGTAAYSFALLAAFYWIIDVKGYRGWAFFFRVIGVNAITIYLMRRFIDFRHVSEFFLGGVAAALPDGWGPVLVAVGYVVAWWLVLLLLDRHKIYLKV